MKLFKNRKARADHYSGDTVPCPGQDEGVSRRDFLGAAVLGGAAVFIGAALPAGALDALDWVPAKPVPAPLPTPNLSDDLSRIVDDIRARSHRYMASTPVMSQLVTRDRRGQTITIPVWGGQPAAKFYAGDEPHAL